MNSIIKTTEPGSAANNSSVGPSSGPFSGLSRLTLATELSATKKMKIAIVGKPKTGKSWLAASAPGYVRIYDFDGREDSLDKLPEEQKSRIAITNIRPMDKTPETPEGLAYIQSELSILKDRKKNNLPIPDWFVFDSVTYLERSIKLTAWAQGVAYRFIKLSPTKTLRLSKNWDSVNAVQGAVEYLITEFSELGNLIFVFHEKPEKDVTESTEEKTAYTDKIVIDPQYLHKSLSLFNDVWRIQLDYNQNYVVTCKPNKDFDGATTLLIDKEEKPNIAQMLEKHKAAKAKTQTQTQNKQI